jgi:hypothetical protein
MAQPFQAGCDWVNKIGFFKVAPIWCKKSTKNKNPDVL